MASPALRIPFILALCLAVALAGCTGGGGPDESQDANRSNFTPVEARNSFDTFTVTALDVTSVGLPGENASALYERAPINVTFTVTNGGERASSEFVTLFVDGQVDFTERVYLDAGESQSFNRSYVRNVSGPFVVEVRTANDRVKEDVNVLARARVGDAQETELLHATVARVFADRPGSTTVNVTVTNPVAEDAARAPTKAGVRLLCAPSTGGGAPFAHAWFEFTPPAPGLTRSGDVPLDRCPSGHVTYGVQFLVWDDAGGDPVALTWLTR